jgi:diguanylate cyclase (GGDEF)-like protein
MPAQGGTPLPGAAHGERGQGREEEISHFVCSFHDITQEKETARHIERLAYYDDLCDLYNRRSLTDIMQRTLQDPEWPVGALLLLDLDNFKSINDSLGHACGDLLLQAVVVRLKSLPQENLVLARTSGDEFALLFTALGQGYITAKILAEHFARELMGLFRAPSTSAITSCTAAPRGDQPLQR